MTTLNERALATTMPHDREAERAVLGAMLISPDACAAAVDRLVPADFYVPVHEGLFAVMVDLYVAGQPVDGVSVRDAARRAGLWGQLDNGVYLTDLIAVPGAPSATDVYARTVQGLAVLRRVATESLRGYQMSTAQEADHQVVPGIVADQMVRAATSHLSVSDVSAGDAAAMAIARSLAVRAGQVTPGIPTGYADLDEVIGGIGPGQLILVAARPGMGKSVVLLNVARHAAVDLGHPVLLCSLEMSTIEVGERLLAAQAKVPLAAIRGGTLSTAQEDQVHAAAQVLAGAPLRVDESTDLTVADLRARALRMARSGGLELIVVDYLQLLRPLNSRADKHVQIGDISRGLKVLAKDVAPVLAASQLNRGPEARPDRKPAMSDLRDSGALEQDADVVILVHREDYYHPETARAGEIDLTVAKHRGGPTGEIALAHQFPYARLVSMFSE
jgi:replicative DNA helicase